ncbi:MAG: sulfatase-like hydrolase/transferase [Burkholderiaceae bacterium]
MARPAEASPRPGAGAGRARALLLALAAALLLNGLLSAENIWPTILIKPDHRLAPEFVLLWCLLLGAFVWRGTVGRKTLNGLAGLYLLLVLGRYLDVTVPALFGRPVNLYWDGLQLPRFLQVAGQALPAWALVLGSLAALSALVRLFLLARAAIRCLAREAVPRAARRPAIWALTGLAVAGVLANLAGVRATWPYISKPVLPTYFQQARVLASAWLPGGIDRALPPSPDFDGDLSGLRGASVKLLFLESYGATIYDNAEIADAVRNAQQRFEQAVTSSGRQLVSAFYRSPTFAGASDLAHLSLLSGIDLSNPLRHDILLTSQRPTLLSHFRKHGYQTIGLYPALSWAWPEKRFYGFDRFIDGPALQYPGPQIGLWYIPDQFTIAQFEQQRVARGDTQPHLLLFPTINTHVPFRPLPPYQPDWRRILSPMPFDPDELARVLADEPDWTRLREPYGRSIRYTYEWLAGYMAQPWLGRDLLILIGDHQPLSGVTGPGASWDVPVHIISSDQTLLARLVASGFEPGMNPTRESRGPMHELTEVLLRAFGGGGPDLAMPTTGAPHAVPIPKRQDWR